MTLTTEEARWQMLLFAEAAGVTVDEMERAIVSVCGLAAPEEIYLATKSKHDPGHSLSDTRKTTRPAI